VAPEGARRGFTRLEDMSSDVETNHRYVSAMKMANGPENALGEDAPVPREM